MAAHLPTETGEDYVPRRLAQAIARAERGELEVVRLIAGHIRGSGRGAKRLLDANRPELTLEHLVLDETTPGRGLLSRELLERAALTLAATETLPDAITTTVAPPGQAMTAVEVGRHLDGLLNANGRLPLALPLVHDAQAILLRIGEGRAHCRRESGSSGSVDLRHLAARREQLRTDSTYRPLQSDLREGSERTTALTGPLLLSLPGVRLGDDGRFLFT